MTVVAQSEHPQPSGGGLSLPGSGPGAKVLIGLARAVAIVGLLLVSALEGTGVLTFLLVNLLWRVERPLHRIGDHDIATWLRPHRFSLHCHEGWWVLCAAALSVVLEYVAFEAWGPGVPSSLATSAWATC